MSVEVCGRWWYSVSTGGEQAVHSGDRRPAPGRQLDEELLADGAGRTLDLPRPAAAGGGVHEFDAQAAQARSSHESTNADPLST